MSTRTEVTLTAAYQAVSAKRAVFTVKEAPAGVKLYLNNASNDTAATILLPLAGLQIIENEVQTIYAKGLGILLLVDQEA